MGNTTAAYTAKRIARGVVIFAFIMTLLASCLSVEAHALGTPTGVKVGFSSDGTAIVVSWSKAKDADEYCVYRKTGNGSWTKLGTTSKPSYTDKAVASCKSYKYKIEAIEKSGIFGWGGVKATKQSKESESICYLKPVTGMTVEYDPIKNVMVVKWAKTSDATEYSVHRSLNGGKGVWYKTVSGLSLEDADISVKQTYGYAAKAQRGNDRGARSAFVTYDLTLNAPTGLKVASTVSNGKQGLKLTWNAVSGAKIYAVYRQVNGGEWTAAVINSGNGNTSYTDWNVESGKTYTYKVWAKKTATVASHVSGTVSGQFFAMPQNVKASYSYDTDNVKLTWSGVGGAEKYEVYYGDKLYSTVSATECYITPQHASKAATAKFSVKAVSGSVKSAAAAAECSIPAALGTPGNVKASYASPGKVKLTWGKVSGAAGYEISRGSETIATVSGTTYTDEAAQYGQTHNYRVRAVNGALKGRMSAMAECVMPPTAPTGVTASYDGTGDGVTVKWSALSGAEKYTIQHKTDSTDWANRKTVTGTSYTDDSPVVGTQNYYRVIAANATGTGPASAFAGVLVLKAPDGVRAVYDADKDIISITWNDNEPATGYNVYKDGKLFKSNIKETYCTDGLIVAGNESVYTVQALYDSAHPSKSRLSSPASVKIPWVKPPTDLKGSYTAENGVTLTWRTNNLYDYVIYRDGREIGRTDKSTFSDKDVKPGASYSYQVKARHTLGTTVDYSELSEKCSVSILRAPTGLSAVYSDESGTITLTWKAVKDVTGYEIYRQKPGESKLTPVAGLADGTAYTETGLEEGEYRFAVKAKAGGTESPYTETVKIDAPKLQMYTITFNTNGGECSVKKAEYSRGTVLDELPTPTLYGIDFLGWYTEKDGGERVQPGISVTEDMTLYAHWLDEGWYIPTEKLYFAHQCDTKHWTNAYKNSCWFDGLGYCCITSKFGYRNLNLKGASTNHKGIDIASFTACKEGKKHPIGGTNVYAVRSGKVISSRYTSGGGNTIEIEHVVGNAKYITVYMHMKDRLVKKNDIVRQGDVIGHVGSTGTSDGAHLHFEIKKNGNHIDPAPNVNITYKTTLCKHRDYDEIGKCCECGIDYDWNKSREKVLGTAYTEKWYNMISVKERPYSAASDMGFLLGNQRMDVPAQVTNHYGDVWYEVKVNGKTGYIYSGDVKLDRNDDTLENCKSFYDTYLDLTLRENTAVKSLPYAKNNGNKSETLATLDAGTVLRAVRIVENRYGNYWYEVTDGKRIGYVYADDCVKMQVPYDMMTGTADVIGSRIDYRSKIPMPGMVTAKLDLRSVLEAVLDLDSGTYSQARETTPQNAKTVVIGSDIKTELLSPGWYAVVAQGDVVYPVALDHSTLMWETYRREVIYREFSVGASVICEPNGGALNGSYSAQSFWVVQGLSDIPAPQAENKAFKGWYTAATGGEEVTDANIFGCTRIYAQWDEDYWTVRFDLNGGECDVTEKRVPCGSAIGTLPVPVRAGAEFAGWYTTLNGEVSVDESTVISGDVTYYARWQMTHTIPGPVIAGVDPGKYGVAVEVREIEDVYNYSMSVTDVSTGQSMGVSVTGTKLMLNGLSLCTDYTGTVAGHKDSVTVNGIKHVWTSEATPFSFSTLGGTIGPRADFNVDGSCLSFTGESYLYEYDYDIDDDNPAGFEDSAYEWSPARLGTTSVSFGGSAITNIPRAAFYNFTNLTSVTLSPTIQWIGDRAFMGSGITTIYIPTRTVPILGGGVFANCPNLTSINVDPANNKFASIGGALYETHTNTLYAYPTGVSGSAVIADGTTFIGAYAAYGARKLTDITLPESVSTIGSKAFANCTALQSVLIPSGVTDIADDTFEGCPASMTIYGYAGSAAEAFAAAHGFAFADISAAGQSVSQLSAELSGKAGENAEWTLQPDGMLCITGIGRLFAAADYEAGAFPWLAYAQQITAVYIGDGIENLPPAAFAGCQALGYVRLPAAMLEIDASAFAGCTALAYIEMQPNGAFGAENGILYIINGGERTEYVVPAALGQTPDAPSDGEAPGDDGTGGAAEEPEITPPPVEEPADGGIDNTAAPAATPEPPPASVESPAAAADAPAVDSPPPEEAYEPSGA